MRISIEIGQLAHLARGLQWTLGLCAGWLIIEPFVMGRPLPPTALETEGVSSSSPLPTTRNPLSLNEFEGVWTRPLQQSLIEPKPKEVPPEKPLPPPPPVSLPRLVATFVEGGQSWGLFLDDRGNQRVRSATQVIDDFAIASIEPGRAMLTRGERHYEVNVARKDHHGESNKSRTKRP